MCNTNEIIAEEVGSINISMYKDATTGLPLFYVKSENEDVLQLSYIIEDFLKLYWYCIKKEGMPIFEALPLYIL